jgi:alpha-tubulin suppressor-like RCC1 family protein
MAGNRRRIVVACLVLVTTFVGAAPAAQADANDAPDAPVGFRSISAGGHHTCAILDDGRVRCWGDGVFGQLGIESQQSRGDGANEMGDGLIAVNLGTSRVATALATGLQHSCAVLDTGQLKCWGGNGSGQLGQGDTTNRGNGFGPSVAGTSPVDLGVGRTVTAVAAGDTHTCALLDDSTVKCWGSNTAGQLGLGDADARGDGPGEMGPSLPAVDLGTGRTATAIAASGNHTCAILDNGQVKCWGANTSGQLGQGDTANRGDQTAELGDALPAVPLGTGRTAVAVSAGVNHTCALLDDSNVTCWGEGGSGQLGQGSGADLGDGPGELGDALAPVALGTGRTAVGVTAGEAHTCAVLDDGTVKCWGDSTRGQLGRGSTASIGLNPGELGDALAPVALGTGRTAIAVSADNHTCAVLDDHRLKCWGDNADGRLGLGDTSHRGDGTGEMGDGLPFVALGTDRTVGPVGALDVETFVALPASVAVGEDLYYELAVFNVGGVRLTDVEVVALQGPVCEGELIDLAPGAGDGLDCHYTPTQDDLGDLTAEFQVITAQGTTLVSDELVTHVVEPAHDLTVTLEPDVSTIDAGGTITYDLRVGNTGNARMTDLTVTPSIDGCGEGAPTELGRGETFQDFCEHVARNADAPTYAPSVTAATAEVDPETGTASTTVRTIRGDALVRVGNGPNVGNGRYNTTGANQARSAVVRNRGTARFTVTAQNDGTAPTNLRVRGLGGTNRFTVTYKVGAANVTPRVVAGTYAFANVAPGASRALTVVVTARNGTPLRAALSRLVTVTDALGAKDAVKLTVTRR